MKKATTIKAGSCSRPARPQKALGACAQLNPASTVSPTREREINRRAVAEILQFARMAKTVVPLEFKRGMSILELATRHGITILCVENLIRRAMGVRL